MVFTGANLGRDFHILDGQGDKAVGRVVGGRATVCTDRLGW